jgi:hypothetical protein
MIRAWNSVVIFIVLMTPQISFGTAQHPDRLVYKGQEYALYADPLQDYYSSLPDTAIIIFPTFGPEHLRTVNSSCWRGYIATWEMINDTMYLVKMEDCRGHGQTANLTEQFGDKIRNGKMKADWYTGELRVPVGKLIEYVHMDYMSQYESEMVLEIVDGVLVKVDKYKNKLRELLPGYIDVFNQDITVMVPEGMEECYDPFTDTLCYEDSAKGLTLFGFNLSQYDDRLNQTQQKEIVIRLIDSCSGSYSQEMKFGHPNYERQRYGYAGWIDGARKSEHLILRIFVISNFNSRFVAYYLAEDVAPKVFRKHLNIFTKSIMYMEFGI